jgi:hypothetical protein
MAPGGADNGADGGEQDRPQLERNPPPTFLASRSGTAGQSAVGTGRGGTVTDLPPIHGVPLPGSRAGQNGTVPPPAPPTAQEPDSRETNPLAAIDPWEPPACSYCGCGAALLAGVGPVT